MRACFIDYLGQKFAILQIYEYKENDYLGGLEMTLVHKEINEVQNEQLLKNISKTLEEKFYFNKQVYAKQQYDENNKVIYKTVYNRIDANIIYYALKNKQAFMAYQQKNDMLKWICLDFDIKTSVLEEGYDFFEDTQYKPMLLEELNSTIIFLESKNITHLVEFSGNRGLHIWIGLNKAVNKSIGSQIIDEIVNQIPLKYALNPDSPIVIDKYPKNGKSKGNKIGLGVKIPLSYHLKSSRYSYIVSDLKKIESINELNDDFLKEQNELLKLFNHNEIENLIRELDITFTSEFNEYERLSATFNTKTELDSIIDMLSKCNVYKTIFSKDISNLSEFDRSMLVGTFNRLKTDVNEEYGKELLLEFFSRDTQKFNVEITKKKIESLNGFFPLSIDYLHAKYNIECLHCKENAIKNIFELLDGVEVNELESDDRLFIKWIIQAEKNYLMQNDEVALNHIYEELNVLQESQIENKYKLIKEGKYDFNEVFVYKRIEEEKLRILHSYGAEDRVLTTLAMFQINKFLYGEYSSNGTYSYRLNYDFNNKDIFINWNKLWLSYVKDIEDKIFNEAYDDYYILKLDIKSFYNEINQIFLREILFSKPSSIMSLILNNMKDSERREYQNLCEYLIQAAKVVNDKGVPQGPAFARYLAEIYLVPLDNIILKLLNDGFEHYFRYVDDMVIILESKEKAEQIMFILNQYLNSRSLNLNNKVVAGYVRDLKYDIITQDLQKYFIDGLDNTTTPSKIIEKAIHVLNRMFKDSDENVIVKNLPFFLTHLIDPDYIESKLDEIISSVVESSVGRGSLFKHFYKNIIFKYLDKIDLSFYKELHGLSRANFINELGKNFKEISLIQLTDILDFLISSDLEKYEAIEIFRIYLKTGIKIKKQLTEADKEIIINLVRYTKNIKWSDELLAYVLQHLQGMTNKEYVLSILEDILCNSDELKDITSIVDTAYILLIEHSEETLVENLKQKAFNLIAFLTLYLNESKVIFLWKTYYKQYELSNSEIKTQDWYKFSKGINKNQIIDSTIIYVFTKVFKKEGIVDEFGASKEEIEYAQFLFLFLFQAENFDNRAEILKNIKRITTENNIEFLKWCLEDNVAYFPNEVFAMKNIQHNNRIVIRKGNEILVRGKPEIFEDYSQYPIQTDQWYDNTQYQFIIAEIDTMLQSIEDKIKSFNILESLDFIINIKKVSEKNGKFVNVFEKGAFNEHSNNLHFVYSNNDEYIIREDAEEIKNNEQSFTGALIGLLLENQSQIITLTSDYVLCNEQFRAEFIPKFIDKRDEWSYLEILNKNFKLIFSEEGLNIYSIDFAKILSIKDFIHSNKRKSHYQSNGKKEIQGSKYSNVLKIINWYNSLNEFNYKSPYEKHLLYGKQELIVDNLESLVQTLTQSISYNLEFDKLNFIKEFLSDEVLKIENEKIQLIKLEKVTLEKHPFDKSKIKINDNDFPIDKFEYYEFGTEDVVKQMEYKDVTNAANNEYLYSNGELIVSMPPILEKTIEIIRDKNPKYDKNVIITETCIVNDPSYLEAIRKIKIQSDVSEQEAKRRLFEFLKAVDSKYYEVLIKLIASYKVFEEQEMDDFISSLKNRIDKDIKTECYFPLKSKEDDNGFHQILFVKNKDSFDRGSVREKRMLSDYQKINQDDRTINEFIFMSDVGISGTQFINTIKKYLDSAPKKGKLYKVSHEKFKTKLLGSSKISILYCIYTDLFEDKVRTFFIEELKYTGELEFSGSKLNHKEHLFQAKVGYKRSHLELFKEFVYKYDSDRKLKINGNSYRDYVDTIEQEDPSNMLIARYKSMPKYHHKILTENTAIFRYRKDS